MPHRAGADAGQGRQLADRQPAGGGLSVLVHGTS
jgi:hypothetical protein